MALAILHDASSSATPWGTVSPFVQVITSPTFALIVDGSNVRLTMFAWTVPVSVESAHGAPADVVAPGAPAVVGAGVPVPEHAARASATPSVAKPRRIGRMSFLLGWEQCAPR